MSQRARCPDFAAILRRGSPDQSLTEQIVNCFAREMEQTARRHCQGAGLAEDATQEAMIAMIEHLPEFRGEAPIDAWLRRLVRTACSRLRRGRKNDPKHNLPLDQAPETAASAPPEQEMRVLLQERLDLLREVLDAIAEPDRSLFLLHEESGLQLSELAKQFDMSLDAVKGRVKRTRAEVRQRVLRLAEAPGA